MDGIKEMDHRGRVPIKEQSLILMNTYMYNMKMVKNNEEHHSTLVWLFYSSSYTVKLYCR